MQPFRRVLLCLSLVSLVLGAHAAPAVHAGPAAHAQAQSDAPAASDRDDAESRTYVNARVGAASTNQSGRPEVCVEGAPLAVLSVEACGTGAQVWHEDPAPEMAHFRLKGRVLSLALPHFWLQGFVGAGFAELQVGNDEPGFAFGSPSESLTSTAGAELALSARALVPLRYGLELLADLGVAGAYMPHADDLVRPQSRFQPTVSFSLGVGF